MSADLRHAEFSNFWRHVKTKQYQTRLDTMSFANLSCIRDSTISFTAGISAVIGGNGVGKSTLAAAVADLLAGAQTESQKLRVLGSRLKGVGVFRDVPHEFYVGSDENDPNDDSDTIPTSSFGWLDPTFPTVILQALHDDARPKELLIGVDPVQLTPDELKQISYLVNKKYDECLIYEIEDYNDLPVFPYFQVRTGSKPSYSTESMGSGELSLLIHFWMLRRLEPRSFLILEEPETYISPHSQMALMNMVARTSSEKKVWTIIITHSPTILRRIALEDTKLLTQNSGNSFLTERTTQKQIEELLGEGSIRRACVLIEDEGARAFLKGLLEKHAPDLLSSAELLVAGDESNIAKVVEALPQTGKWLKVVGVFDGGMQSSRKDMKKNWPILFLPGEGDPDAILKDLLSGEDNQRLLASGMGKSAEEVMVASNELAGVDYHDWPLRMSHFLNSDIHSVRKHIVDIWLMDEERDKSARLLASELRAALET